MARRSHQRRAHPLAALRRTAAGVRRLRSRTRVRRKLRDSKLQRPPILAPSTSKGNQATALAVGGSLAALCRAQRRAILRIGVRLGLALRRERRHEGGIEPTGRKSNSKSTRRGETHNGNGKHQPNNATCATQKPHSSGTKTGNKTLNTRNKELN